MEQDGAKEKWPIASINPAPGDRDAPKGKGERTGPRTYSRVAAPQPVDGLRASSDMLNGIVGPARPRNNVTLWGGISGVDAIKVHMPPLREQMRIEEEQKKAATQHSHQPIHQVRSCLKCCQQKPVGNPLLQTLSPRHHPPVLPPSPLHSSYKLSEMHQLPQRPFETHPLRTRLTRKSVSSGAPPPHH